MRIELPYGRRPYVFEVEGRPVHLVKTKERPAPAPVGELIERAIDAPIGGPPLTGKRVTVIVSDASRKEPRDAFVRAVRRRLPDANWTIAIATGTHGPCGIDRLGLSDEALHDATVIDHDGHRADDLVLVGTTARGTPVRVHRCVLDCDLVIATGCVRPHYFAGFGAGVKAIFPGLGESSAIRMNHRLKTEPSARAGIFVGNACRDDLEEAVAMIPTPKFLLDGVSRPDDRIEAVVAGDVVEAFRAGAAIATELFHVDAVTGPLVIASDALPISASLYQAAKIAAAAAPLVDPGGTLVLAAECAEGIGPLDTVNEAIFRIGVLPRLAAGVRLVLVSELGQAATEQTLLDYAPSVESILATTSCTITVVPHASKLLL